MSSNLEIWNFLGRTDPDHTKGFNRSGGFRGTAIKPIYTERKMTEQFGPVGTGWGFTTPTYQVVPGENREVMVFCWLSVWYVKDGVRSEPVPGVGGDKIITHIKADAQKNRPERWDNDDEAFKKAFTDALGNAMKHLGMSADVHMGLFEDSKYLREVREDIAEQKRQEDQPSLNAYVEVALKKIAAVGTRDELIAWWKDQEGMRGSLGLKTGDANYTKIFEAYRNRGTAISVANTPIHQPNSTKAA